MGSLPTTRKRIAVGADIEARADKKSARDAYDAARKAFADRLQHDEPYRLAASKALKAFATEPSDDNASTYRIALSKMVVVEEVTETFLKSREQAYYELTRFS